VEYTNPSKTKCHEWQEQTLNKDRGWTLNELQRHFDFPISKHLLGCGTEGRRGKEENLTGYDLRMDREQRDGRQGLN
jgi:hypothetical protein